MQLTIKENTKQKTPRASISPEKEKMNCLNLKTGVNIKPWNQFTK